jgi:hypothetical protein
MSIKLFRQIPLPSASPFIKGALFIFNSFPLDKEGGPLAVGDLKKLHPEG